MNSSVPTSTETITIHPAPEPAATYDVVERALIAAAGLSAMILHDADVPPHMRLRYGSLLAQSKSECQCAAIRLARATTRESERDA